ncbi:MAG TPA: MgtC/SapB family protein [Terriglobales bacterium]|nr:MgtC/SapB family protein [Terriglobales bacterium]
MIQAVGGRMAEVLSTTIVRLAVAALLGAIIGLERELRHKPAGLRTNIFICFGAAMFTVLSNQLAAGFGGDHTRIAAQIIPGIGFIGAGSILHARGSITGLTTAATLFVVASVGMATGGGLYITAVFATVVILIALALLGQLERRFELKSMRFTFEVTGKTTDTVLNELSHVLDAEELGMEDVNAVGLDGLARIAFSVKCVRPEADVLTIRLHESSLFSSVKRVGAIESE